MNRRMCSGISRSWSFSRGSVVALCQANINSEHSLGATLEVTEMQP